MSTGYMGKKRCYNCNELGHISTQCPKSQKIKKCYTCNQLGHVAANCTKKRQSEASGSAVLLASTAVPRITTWVKIGNTRMLALIDTGSDVNLIRLREYLEALPGTLDNDSIPLSGLGSIRVKTLGSLESVIEINGSHFLTKVHVVPNDALAMPLILGQSLLTQAIF
ncbi:Retroviral aspartyl protease [Popillia japonica]|uniref:Retroviral aspartyl protease n=1 Tax=Popillia japonica TaxID=7064 RepID=A0AAW1IC72_POPJA